MAKTVQVEDIDCVLLDIEGTICPISFVKDTLFPYALTSLPRLLPTLWTAPTFQPYISAFPAEHATTQETFLAHVRDLTERDVKVAYLKNLQGFLWEEGYENGSYGTPLFGDVGGKLREWVRQEGEGEGDGEGKGGGKKVAIYSSGSVFAQKLLFGHVLKEDGGESGEKGGEEVGEKRKWVEDDAVEGEEEKKKKRKVGGDGEGGKKKEKEKGGVVVGETEDLKGLVSAWFDTTNAGLKTEKASYEKIAGELELKPERVLFLTDNVKEVDAAVAAGMKSLLVDRPGNNPVTDEDRKRLTVIESFGGIRLIPGKDS